MSIAAKLVLLLTCLVAGFGSGVKWHAGIDAQKEIARQVNQRAEERLRRQNTDTAAVAYEGQKVVIQKQFVPITQEVERVVTQIQYRDRACFDPDGVRAINAAVARTSDDPGKPRSTVSAAGGTP